MAQCFLIYVSKLIVKLLFACVVVVFFYFYYLLVLEVISDQKISDENSTSKKTYAHEMVRTDSRERKLQAFFSPTAKSSIEKQMGSIDMTDTSVRYTISLKIGNLNKDTIVYM